ncbi:hypothetical protein BKA70DRAFT_1243214 [Coprinopsis sp. MPI-PUGE-AT-0042]|nr:hypothetical protein BKA70DRAFT_1243214 [Coprinopsis sp. MPI-PUGE-AT-0042]
MAKGKVQKGGTRARSLKATNKGTQSMAQALQTRLTKNTKQAKKQSSKESSDEDPEDSQSEYSQPEDSDSPPADDEDEVDELEDDTPKPKRRKGNAGHPTKNPSPQKTRSRTQRQQKASTYTIDSTDDDDDVEIIEDKDATPVPPKTSEPAASTFDDESISNAGRSYAQPTAKPTETQHSRQSSLAASPAHILSMAKRAAGSAVQPSGNVSHRPPVAATASEIFNPTKGTQEPPPPFQLKSHFSRHESPALSITSEHTPLSKVPPAEHKVLTRKRKDRDTDQVPDVPLDYGDTTDFHGSAHKPVDEHGQRLEAPPDSPVQAWTRLPGEGECVFTRYGNELIAEVYGPLSLHAEGRNGNYQPHARWFNVQSRHWEYLPLGWVSCKPPWLIPLEVLLRECPEAHLVKCLKDKYGRLTPIITRSYDYLARPKLPTPTRGPAQSTSSSLPQARPANPPAHCPPSRTVRRTSQTPAPMIPSASGLTTRMSKFEIERPIQRSRSSSKKAQANEPTEGENESDQERQRDEHTMSHADVEESMTALLREGVPLADVRDIKRGKPSGDEKVAGGMLRQYVLELAAKHGRPVDFFLKLAGLVLSEERALTLWQLFQKVAATRSNVPTGAAFNDWAPKEFHRIKVQRAKDGLDDDSWFEELINELRESGTEFGCENPTETAVKNIQITNARLKNLAMQVASTSSTKMFGLSFSHDAAAAQWASAHSSHDGLQSWCKENKVEIRDALFRFSSLLKYAILSLPSCITLMLSFSAVDSKLVKLDDMSVMDLLIHVLGVSKDTVSKSVSKDESEAHMVDDTTKPDGAADDDIPTDEDAPAKQDSTVPSHPRPIPVKSYARSAPTERKRKAGNNGDWRERRHEFNPPHRQGDGTHWEPGPKVDKGGYSQRNYMHRITRDMLKADYAVAADIPIIKDGIWGNIIEDMANHDLRLINWPANAPIPEIDFQVVGDLHLVLGDTLVKEMANAYLENKPETIVPRFVPLSKDERDLDHSSLEFASLAAIMSVGTNLGDPPIVRARFGDSQSLMTKFKVSKHTLSLMKGYALKDSLEANTNHLRDLGDTVPPSPDYAKKTLEFEQTLKKTKRLNNKLGRIKKGLDLYSAQKDDNSDIGVVQRTRQIVSNIRSAQVHPGGTPTMAPPGALQPSMGPPSFPPRAQCPFLASGYASDASNVNHRPVQYHRHASQPVAGPSRLPSNGPQQGGHYAGGPHYYPPPPPPPPGPHGCYDYYHYPPPPVQHSGYWSGDQAHRDYSQGYGQPSGPPPPRSYDRMGSQPPHNYGGSDSGF